MTCTFHSIQDKNKNNFKLFSCRCPGDKYQCSSGACVKRNWLCNGFRDCHDGDDEISTVCQANK